MSMIPPELDPQKVLDKMDADNAQQQRYVKYGEEIEGVLLASAIWFALLGQLQPAKDIAELLVKLKGGVPRA